MKKVLLLVLFLLSAAHSVGIIRDTVSPTGSPRATLKAALDAHKKNLITADSTLEIWIVGDWSGKWDTTSYRLDSAGGYRTDSTHKIKIATAGAARHAGKWDTTKYRYSMNNKSGFSIWYVDFVDIDGLQFEIRNATAGGKPLLSDSNATAVGYKCNFYNNIFKATNIGSNAVIAYDHYFQGTSRVGQINFYNNIFYDFKPINAYCIYVHDFCTLRAYNNTFYNSFKGISLTSGASTTGCLINNIFNYCDIAASGTFLAGSDYNSTNLSSMGYTVTGGGNTHDRLSQAFTFADSAGRNLHLASTDTAAKDRGKTIGAADSVPGLTMDIDGVTRSGSWDIGADEYASACTPATITAHATFTDTVGNTGRFGHAIANAFDSVKLISTWPDSTAMLAYTTKDTIAYHWKAKQTKAGFNVRIFSCAGANTADAYDTITIIGPSVAYTSSPKLCTLGVAMTQAVTSTAMADSFTLKAGSPAWLSIYKTGGSMGNLYGTPNTGMTKTGVWVYVWRRGVKADSTADSITVFCNAPTITAHANITDTIGNSGRFGHATGGGTRDSAKLIGSWPDSTAMVAYATKDTVAYHWKSKHTKAGYAVRAYGCDSATAYDTITVIGPSLSYSSSPRIDTVDAVAAAQDPASTAMADSITFATLPTGLSVAKTGGTMGRISGTPAAYAAKTGYKGIVWRKGIRADSTYDTISVVYGSIILDSIRPSTGYVGNSLTIYGRGFGASQGGSAVTMGGTSCSVLSWANKTISLTVPSLDTGYYDFIVSDGSTADTILQGCKILPSSNVRLCTLVVVAGAHGSVGRTRIIDSTNVTWRDTATANSGYLFDHWTARHSNVSFADAYSRFASITVTASDTIDASFRAWPTYTLTTSATNGSIGLNPAGGTYDSGTVATLTATPSARYIFSGWSGNLTGTTNPATVTMSANKSVTASFRAWPTYTLTMAAGTGGTVLPATGSVDSAASTSISASPGSHYIFSKWTRSGTAATIADSTSATTSVILTGTATVTGNFTCVAPTISYATKISGTLGVAITAQSATIGGGGADSVKSITPLPGGLTCTKTGANMGHITGTPTSSSAKAGYRIRVYGCDSADTWDTITINSNPALNVSAKYHWVDRYAGYPTASKMQISPCNEAGWVANNTTGIVKYDSSHTINGVRSVQITDSAKYTYATKDPVTTRDLSADFTVYVRLFLPDTNTSAFYVHLFTGASGYYLGAMTVPFGNNRSNYVVTGWNTFVMDKSQFAVGSGSPSWANINKLRIGLKSKDGTISTVYVGDVSVVPKQLAKGTVWFSCDDGYKAQSDSLLPSLNAYGWGASIFVIWGWLGDGQHLTKSGLDSMYKYGWDIGVHELKTASYNMPDISVDSAYKELKYTADSIAASGYIRPRLSAWPGNATNHALDSVAKLLFDFSRIGAYNPYTPVPFPEPNRATITINMDSSKTLAYCKSVIDSLKIYKTCGGLLFHGSYSQGYMKKNRYDSLFVYIKASVDSGKLEVKQWGCKHDNLNKGLLVYHPDSAINKISVSVRSNGFSVPCSLGTNADSMKIYMYDSPDKSAWTLRDSTTMLPGGSLATLSRSGLTKKTKIYYNLIGLSNSGTQDSAFSIDSIVTLGSKSKLILKTIY